MSVTVSASQPNAGKNMVNLSELVNYCNALLSCERFNDYCPNGLQVEGKSNITTLISGVTASQALIDAAISAKADAILVHHGYFWQGENPTVTGMKKRRIQALLEHDISLLAYHLPLDAHPEYGNNATLARILSFECEGVAASGPAKDILFYGQLAEAMPLSELTEHISGRLNSQALSIVAGDALVKTIAWCTGGAQAYIQQAAELGVDAYLSGEISEQTTHFSRENNIHYIAAGHHATERFGAQALGEHLAGEFKLQHNFVDIENPA